MQSNVVVEGEGAQVSFWQNFYEEAWGLRAKFMEELIEQGERDPFRIISILEHRHRYFNILTGDEHVEWRERVHEGELLPTGLPVLHHTSFRGNYVVAPYYVSQELMPLIVDYAMHCGPFDCIVELGCGYGQNLFRIFSRGGPNIPYYGGEFTDSGVVMARKLAALVPERDYRFFHFNHLKPDLSEFPRHKRALVFTCHSIEQVLDLPKSWFDVVAGYAEEVHCIHLEPFGFQLQTLGPLSTVAEEAFRDRGWNRNLGPVALEAANRGVVKIDHVVLELGYSDSPANMTSFMFWRNPGAVAASAST